MLAFLLLPAAVQQQGTALLAPELAADHISSQLPPPRQHELQRKTYAELADRARAASDAATPELLALLDSSSFRQQVATYVPSLANETADDLLERLRSIFATAEILHNFDGGWDADMSVEFAERHQAQHFASTFEVRYASESESEAAGGDGTAAADADKQQSYRVRHKDATANQGIFGLPPFGGDEKPRDYTEATSRLTYGALNLMRRSVGQVFYGDVAAVFHPRYWAQTAVSPIDSGLWTMSCNESYKSEEDAVAAPFELEVDCDRDPTPGVPGAMDHVLLNYDRMRGREMLTRLLIKWTNPNINATWRRDAIQALGSAKQFDYAEANVLGNVHFADHGVKLLVANLNTLFGTDRGSRLRAWARKMGLVLTWAMSYEKDEEVYQREPIRLLDPLSCEAGLLNISCARSANEQFERVWEATTAGSSETLDQLSEMLPADYTISMPSVGDCADWDRCLGRTRAGAATCACFANDVESPVVR